MRHFHTLSNMPVLWLPRQPKYLVKSPHMKGETQEHYRRYFVLSLLLLSFLWVPLAGRCSSFYPVGVSPRPTVCVTLSLSFVIQK